MQVFNNGPNTGPIGVVEFPLLNANWFGNCFPVSPGGPSGGPTDIVDPRLLMFVNGWALEASLENTGGVSEVRVALDGVPIKNSRVNCHREFLLANALIDCYGYYRPDIEVLYPGFAQAPNVGFQFFVDAGYLLTQKGFREGAHIIQVSAVDKRNTAVLLKEIPITMECATGQLDPPPLGFIDDPTNYKFIGGVFPVIGWALDLDVVVKVRILIDGVAAGRRGHGRGLGGLRLREPGRRGDVSVLPAARERALPLLPRHDEDLELRARPPHRGHGRARQRALGRHAPLHRRQQHARPLSGTEETKRRSS